MPTIDTTVEMQMSLVMEGFRANYRALILERMKAEVLEHLEALADRAVEELTRDLEAATYRDLSRGFGETQIVLQLRTDLKPEALRPGTTSCA